MRLVRAEKGVSVEITVLIDNEPSRTHPHLRTERGHSLYVRWRGRSLRERLWLSLFGLKKEVSLDPEVVTNAHERLRLVTEDSEPEEGLHLLVRVPDAHPRPLGNQLLLSGPPRQRVPDTLAHELVMVLEDGDGLVVFTGCGHRGVLDVVDAVRMALPDRPIKAVVGGFHFVGFPFFGLFVEPRERILEVGRALEALPIGRIVTGHYTGRAGTRLCAKCWALTLRTRRRATRSACERDAIAESARPTDPFHAGQQRTTRRPSRRGGAGW